MGVLRTIRCRSCGERHLLGQPCPCGGRPRTRSRSQTPLVIGTFVLTIIIIVSISMMIADSTGKPILGILTAGGCWFLMTFWRLGYDWEDGVDMFRLLLVPFPFDFSAQWESFMNFWTRPRPYFRVIYIGAYFSCWIVVLLLGADVVLR